MFQTSIFDSELKNNPSGSLALIKEHFPIKDLIPASWVYKFHKRFGRKRDYSLSSFLLAFILQRALTIPTTELLIAILNISSELREFCGFDKVPDKSKFSRFKSSFHNELEEFFHSIVDLTEPICRAIDAEASKTLIIDTTGIEVYVTENNPKFFASIQKKIENYYKSRNEEVDPAKVIMQACLPDA
ncbi:MAG TPA: transposase [Pseudobacteroides sp.]|nr:transposase [Pseudobacteroides sp.]